MKKFNRRTFFKSAAAISAASLLPRFAIGKPGPSANSKLNMAFVGVAGRGEALLRASLSENLVAFCDVDEDHAGHIFAEFPDVPRFKDFRDMLDKMGSEIDAVCIATPNHTHFVATYAAMALGKHVLTEKPLTHTVWEARTLRKAAKRFKVVTQMGNQGHAMEGIRIIKEWCEAGIIGEVREVIAYNRGARFGPNRYFNRPARWPTTPEPVPDTLDWYLWRGPVADDIQYNEVYLPKTWRAFYDFGDGQLGDWACHTLDGAFWALDLDVPTAVEVSDRDDALPGLMPERSIITFHTPREGKAPLKITWNEGLQPAADPSWGWTEWPRSAASVIVGEKGCITAGGYSDKPRLYPESLWEDVRTHLPAKKYPRIKGNHVDEWIRAIKGEGPEPGSNFGYASRLTELTLLGVLAQRTGKNVEWDAAGMKVTNDAELNKYIKTPFRRGWAAGEELWL